MRMPTRSEWQVTFVIITCFNESLSHHNPLILASQTFVLLRKWNASWLIVSLQMTMTFWHRWQRSWIVFHKMNWIVFFKTGSKWSGMESIWKGLCMRARLCTNVKSPGTGLSYLVLFFSGHSIQQDLLLSNSKISTYRRVHKYMCQPPPLGSGICFSG
jgi:hypothetical protein